MLVWIKSIFLTLSLIFIIFQPTYAAIRIEKISLYIEEKKGETSMKVDNIGNYPVLLFSSVLSDELSDKGKSPLFILSPPVVRIEPGASQLIRIIIQDLSQLKELNQQLMRRISFHEIPGIAKNNEEKQQLKLSIQHNILATAHPNGLAVDNEPWKHLVFSRQNDQTIHVMNESNYIVRLLPSAKLLPDNITVTFDRAYLLPKQTLNGTIVAKNEKQKIHVMDKNKEIEITPISYNGQILSPNKITLK